MSKCDLFSLNTAKCTKCGLCVSDCFFGALRRDANGTPYLKNSDRCMQCQHCFAICPKGAISFKGHCAESAPAMHNLVLPDENAMDNLIRARRSVRHYADKDVDPSVLKRILNTLGNAPTGCNARSLQFTCISNRKAMNELRHQFIKALENFRLPNGKLIPRWIAAPAIQLRNGKRDIFFRGATGLLIISSNPKAPGVTTPNEDVVVAAAQFDLLAQTHGLGTCWCGFLNLIDKEIPSLLPDVIGIPDGAPFSAVLFGHPAIKYARCVLRDQEATIDWRE